MEGRREGGRTWIVSPIAKVSRMRTLGSSGLFFSDTTSITPGSPLSEEGTNAARITLSSGVLPIRVICCPRSNSITCVGRGNVNLYLRKAPPMLLLSMRVRATG